MKYGEYLDMNTIPGLFTVLCVLFIFLVFGTRLLLMSRFRRRTLLTAQPARAFGEVLRNSGAPFWKRKMAARSLGVMSTPSAVEELLTFFRPRAVAEDGKITNATIRALSMTESAGAVECLREHVARLIILCDNPTQPNTSRELKKRVIRNTGEPAIRALAKMGNPSAVPILKRTLEVKVLNRQAKKALKKIVSVSLG